MTRTTPENITVNPLYFLLQIYGKQKQKPRDEKQKSLRPILLKADHQWYLDENNDANQNVTEYIQFTEICLK